ncbi:MAG: nitrogen fixation protein NifZ [Psychromonas sp.]|jgi:nitrogen fixation protein NifZ|uniref:nitrogen fixation protein NifZ n=1 Tax=Psychromonas sp. TaxID=1884585 RepID=UPI0039E4902A
MDATFDYGDKVRVIKNIRNDGTFMGSNRGALLIRRGSVGYIKGVGKFLQDQVIYQVHFIEQGCTVGCRESELGAIDAPWVERLFERGDNVITQKSLSSAGKIVVSAGDSGTILGLESNQPPLFYRVSFKRINGLETNSWLIPETILTLDETKPSIVAIEMGRLGC